MKEIKGGVTAALGFKASGVAAGLKKNGVLDVAMITSDTPAVAALMTTSNAVKAAPVLWDNAIVRTKGKAIRAIVANSGNANACTGQQGLKDAETTAAETAKRIGCETEQVFVSSTGVIGVPLPVDKIVGGLDALVAGLSKEGWDTASRAILTTDTVAKTLAVEVTVDGQAVHIGGMAKGSGMICPNMATMLSFVTTDAVVDPGVLQEMLAAITRNTYNMMSVDGDMSTNDTVVVLANGQAGNGVLTKDHPDYQAFYDALYFINETLAKSIVRDGEGANKLIEMSVEGMDTEENARILAKAAINSSLVKTAIFGEDANWGRVLSSIGAAGVAFDPVTVSLWFASTAGKIKLLEKGSPIPFDEDTAAAILKENEIQITVDMAMGAAGATAWGCDLSYEYVKINGEYRT